MAYPKVLAAKNPCPPHLSLIIAVLLSVCQPTKVLSTQQIIKRSCSCPFWLANVYLAKLWSIFKPKAREIIGINAFF